MSMPRPRLMCLILAGLIPGSVWGELVVRGAIHDRHGGPVQEAEVRILPLPSNFESGRRLASAQPADMPAAVARSTSAGRFVLEAPGPGIWKLSVQAKGFVSMQYLPLVLVESRELAPVRLDRDLGLRVRLHPPPAVDRPGAGLRGLSAFARPVVEPGSPAGGWMPDDRRGRFGAEPFLSLPRIADEELEIHLCGPGSVGRSKVTGGADQVTFEVTPARGAVIEVRDPADRPVAGALVQAGELGCLVGLTGPRGRLRVPVGDEGTIPIRLLTADGRSGAFRVGAGTAHPVFELEPPVWLGGRVLDEEGRPLAGAVVWTGADPGSFVRTDAAGRYRMSAPPGPRFWIQAEAAGYLPLATWVSAAHLAGGRIPTLGLSRPAMLSGTVVDSRGQPVEGAALSAVLAPPGRRDFSSPDPADSRSESDGEGAFTLTRLSPGRVYRLRVRRAGLAERTVTTTADLAADQPLEIVLAPERTATGVVVDVAGQPVPGALVALRDPAAEAAAAEALTDAGGRFRLAEVPAPVVDVEVSKPAFAPLRMAGFEVPPGEGPADLGRWVLTPGARLAGRVLDRAGEAVEGAAIHLLREVSVAARMDEDLLRRRLPAVVTGRDGRFVLSEIVPGEPFNLFVDGAGYVPAWRDGVEAPLDEELKIVLGAAASIRGEVSLAAGGPVAGAEVAATWRHTLQGSRKRHKVAAPVVRRARSDPEGMFELDGIRPGEVAIEVWLEGFISPPAVELTATAGGRVEGVRLELERGAQVTGRVRTRDGEPIVGARVSAGRAAAATDAEGAYSLAGVATGKITARVFHPHYETRTEEVEIVPGSQILDWTLPAGVEVAGRVLGRYGSPLEGARVELSRGSGAPGPRARSTADGTFLFPSVAAGPYRIRAHKAGYAVFEGREELLVDADPVAELEIVLSRGAGISGAVRGLGVRELGRVAIRAESRTGRIVRGRCDYRGRYEIGGLAAGDWRVEASVDGGRRQAQARLVIAPGDRQIVHDLEFEDRWVLSGTVSFDGRPLARTSVALQGRDRAVRRTVATDYRGDFRIEDLEAGAYGLEVRHTSELLVHNEMLEILGDRHLDLELGTARVGGEIVESASRRPIPEAVVELRRVVDGPGVVEFLVAAGSDGEGRFEMPRVPPGRYRLRARKDGYAPVTEEIDVRAGIETDGLTVALAASGGLTLAARLASEAVPPYVTVQVRDAGGRAVVSESRSLEGGEARFPTVPAGEWELLVTAPGAVLTGARASVPGPPVEVILPPAGRLDVRVPALATEETMAGLRVYDLEGEPFRGMSSGGSLADQWELVAGVGTLDGLPAGAWKVEVLAPDGRSWSAWAETTGSGTTSLVLE